MTSVYVKATVASFDEYDLINGLSKYLTLSTLNTYKFYISAEFEQIVYMEFSESDPSSISSQYINIYEYSSRYSKVELKQTNLSLTYDSSKISYSISYNVYYSTCAYVAFEIQTYNQMTYISIKATVKKKVDYEYDLSNGNSQYFPFLFSSYTYKFYIYSIYGRKVDIELYKSDSSSISEQYIIIYEYSSRNTADELIMENYELPYNYSTNSSSITYTVYNSLCSYVAFEIKPNYRISSVYVKATVDTYNYEYDLTSGSSKYFSVLYTLDTYKFYIPATSGHKVDIEFKKNDSSSTSDQNITIYEYSNRNSTTGLWKTNLYLSYDYSINTYSISYNIYDTSSNYVAFEIQPYYKMTSIYVKATVEKTISSTMVLVLILILIPSIIIISIIALLIWCNKRKKNDIIKDFQNPSNPSTQPLYPLQPVNNQMPTHSIPQ